MKYTKGNNGNWLGRKHSEESKKKISLARTGNKYPKLSESKKGKKLSEEHKAKLKAAKVGFVPWNKGRKAPQFSREKNPAWKGGVTPVNNIIRHSFQYKLWRIAVFKRDNYTCIWCKAKNGDGKRVILNADHIKPFALFPELRFAIDNGRTLCLPCHKTTPTYGVNKK